MFINQIIYGLRFTFLLLLVFQCLVIAESTVDLEKKLQESTPEGRPILLNKLAKEYLFTENDAEKALHRYINALEEAEALGYIDEVVAAHIGLGFVYKQTTEFEKSMSAFKKALSFRKQLKDEKLIVSATNEIGNLHFYKNDLALSMSYHNEALALARKIDYKFGIFFITNDIAIITYTNGKYTEALEIFKGLLVMDVEAGELDIASIYINIASCLLPLKEYDLALENNKKGREIAEKHNDLGIEASSYWLLNEIKLAQKKYEDAHEALSRHLQLKIKLMQQEADARASEMLAQFETKQKVSHLKKKHWEKEFQRNILLLCSLFISVIALVLFRNFRRSKQMNAELNTQNKNIQAKHHEVVELNMQLNEAMEEIKQLSGMLPICASCKKIRDDHGYWQQIEGYLSKHSEISFSHSICPDCIKTLYPEFKDKMASMKNK